MSVASFFRGLFGGGALAPGPEDDFWYQGLVRSTASGEDVDEETAMLYSAVFCASRILAETVASLPLKVYQRVAGERVDRSDHPVQALLRTINPETCPAVFREGRTMHQVNTGVGLAEIERNRAGMPVQLWPIHPTRVELRRDKETGRIFFRFLNPSDGDPIPLEDMLAFPGVLSNNGITGKGIIQQARESIGMGLATERHGAAWFGNSGIPTVAITQESRGLDKEARAAFRKDWTEMHAGAANAHKPAILPQGMDIKALSISNSDSQFLETRKHNVNEISRWYRIPPHMLGDLDRATFSNIEFQGIEFLTQSLLPWLVKQEQEYGKKLFSKAERDAGYYVEHNVAGLLRGDTKSRFESYKTGIMNGWLSVNDVRKLENMNAIGPEGDVYLAPLNVTTLQSIVEGGNLKQEPVADDEPEEEPQDEGNAIEQQSIVLESIVTRLDCIEDMRQTQREAARKAVEERLKRLQQVEANTLTKSSKNASGFIDRAEKFYAKHSFLMAAELVTLDGVCRLAGVNWKPDQIASTYCKQAQESVLALCDEATADDLPGKVLEWTEQLNSQLPGLLADIFKGAEDEPA